MSFDECFFNILATIPEPENISAQTSFLLPILFSISIISFSIFPSKLRLFPR